VAPRLKQVSLLLAILGLVIFIIGAATGRTARGRRGT
jgi:hypothetical protein